MTRLAVYQGRLMFRARSILRLASVGLMILGAGAAHGQAFPNKTIRILTSNVGSGSDFTSRLISQGISNSLGQAVIVENRSGTQLSVEIVAKALPDGYSLLAAGTSFWTLPLLQKTTYDPVKDFSPITSTDKSSHILVVHPSIPVTSVQELIALAKARPGQLNIATGLTASSAHLAMELFKSMAGINIVRIPYKGGALALAGLLSGEAQVLFSNDVTIMSHAKAGRLKALAVTSSKPTLLAPGLPTVAASGLPGFEAGVITGIFAPARTPAAIINLLNLEIVRFLKTAEVKEKFFNAGLEIVGDSPSQLAAIMKSDMAISGKVIKEAGIKNE